MLGIALKSPQETPYSHEYIDRYYISGNFFPELFIL